MARNIRLVACLMNISEAQNIDIVKQVAGAAVLEACKQYTPIRGNETVRSTTGCYETETPNCRGAVLNVFSDTPYNRSVITIGAHIEHIEDIIHAACLKAYELVDLSGHKGGHPRLGAVDLLPLHPLSSSVSIRECGDIARRLADRLSNDVPGTSFFLFGSADTPHQRGLVVRRKAVNWYKGENGIDYSKCTWDVGAQPSSRYGITGIGAMPYMMNFNITINTSDLTVGKEIAATLRASTPNSGLHGIQTMAFEHNGRIEIACNVETGDLQDPAISSKYTSRGTLEDAIRGCARQRNVDIFGKALIGLSPESAYDRLVQALSCSDPSPWERSQDVLM